MTPDHNLASILAAEIRSVSSRLKRRWREQGLQLGLTPSQSAVLLRLEKDGPATVSALARAEAMRPQSMSAIVKPLQQGGLVKGIADPTDGRQILMALTPKCVRRLQQGRAGRLDWLTTTIDQKLSEPEQKRLQSALRLLHRLVEE